MDKKPSLFSQQGPKCLCLAPSSELPAAARELLMSRGSQQSLRRDRSPLFPRGHRLPLGGVGRRA